MCYESLQVIRKIGASFENVLRIIYVVILTKHPLFPQDTAAVVEKSGLSISVRIRINMITTMNNCHKNKKKNPECMFVWPHTDILKLFSLPLAA